MDNHAVLYQYSFNMKTGAVNEKPLDDAPTEFPRVNDNFALRSTKFGYCGTGTGDFFSSMLKYELGTGKKESHDLGAGKMGWRSSLRPSPRCNQRRRRLARQPSSTTKQRTRANWWSLPHKTSKPNPLREFNFPCEYPTGFHGAWVPGLEMT